MYALIIRLFLEMIRTLRRTVRGANKNKKKLSVVLHDQEPILINCKGRSGRTWLFLSGVSTFPLRTTPLGLSLLAFNHFSRWCVFPSDFSIRFYQLSPLLVLGGAFSRRCYRCCIVVSVPSFPCSRCCPERGGIPSSLVFGSRISANSSRRSSFWWSPVTIGRPPFFSGHPARTRPDAIKGKNETVNLSYI